MGNGGPILVGVKDCTAPLISFALKQILFSVFVRIKVFMHMSLDWRYTHTHTHFGALVLQYRGYRVTPSSFFSGFFKWKQCRCPLLPQKAVLSADRCIQAATLLLLQTLHVYRLINKLNKFTKCQEGIINHNKPNTFLSFINLRRACL